MESNVDKIMMEDRKNIRLRFDTDLKHVEDWYQKAWGLYESDHAEEAFELFMKAALNDHPLAQYMVGTMYLDGYGTEEDIDNALLWLRKAANLYVPQAFRTLGQLYYRGDRVVRDVETGAKLIRIAADMGDPEGQYIVGLILKMGGRMMEALELMTKSAENGYPPAMDCLGMMHLLGRHPESDRDTGIDLIRSAAEKGEPKAMVHLAISMLDDESKEADAIRLCRESAAMGDTLGMITLGVLIAEGQCGSPDPETGAVWFRRAAEKGDGRAMRLLGELINDGRIEPKDGEDATFWFGRAEEVSSHLENIENMGASYDKSVIVTEEAHQP